jgi:LysM domain
MNPSPLHRLSAACSATQAPRARAARTLLVAALVLCALPAWSQGQRPVSPQQRETAQRVAQAGVPLDALAPNAPDSHTVQRGDTLWSISSLFLKSPWRWPEMWGMNLDQIRNPHLIYPGQMLVLDKSSGRAQLRVGARVGGGEDVVRLSPRVRQQTLENGAIASIPLHLLGPFLNEAVVFDGDDLTTAPRIVATQEGRVMVSRGETAYVRGDLGGARDFRVFRELTPMVDPASREVLGFEGRYVGTAEFVRPEQEANAETADPTVPATFRVTSTRMEAGVGDRLSPVPQQDLLAFVPRAPDAPIEGRIVSVYGESVRAGQNQVVALNMGKRDGLARGHVLALWRAGRAALDTTTDGKRATMRLPDERHGVLFVFRVFERVSYALIVSVQEPVQAGDRFTQP